VLIAQTRTAKTLDIYVMDVEGGNSQLYVTPSGESVLIDTGNIGAAAVRDAERTASRARSTVANGASRVPACASSPLGET